MLGRSGERSVMKDPAATLRTDLVSAERRWVWLSEEGGCGLVRRVGVA